MLHCEMLVFQLTLKCYLHVTKNDMSQCAVCFSWFASASMIRLLLFYPFLSGLFICDYASFVLAHFSPFPSFHSSIPLSFCPSVYVALSMLARASLLPCWFSANSPTLLFPLLFTHPHLPSSPSSSHFACVPGSGGLSTVYSPVA